MLELNRLSHGFLTCFLAKLSFGLDPVAHLIARHLERAAAFRNVVGAEGNIMIIEGHR